MELLIAMVIGVMLLILLNSTLDSVQSGLRRIRLDAPRDSEKMTGIRFVSQALAQAFPPDPTDTHTQFIGTSDRLEFVTVPPEAQATRGPVKMRLYTKLQENGQKELLMEMDTVNPENGLGVNPHASATRLFGELTSVSFAYKDQTVASAADASTWNASDRLPALITLTLSFADKGKKPTVLAVMPRRSISGRCKFDLISLSCRT